MKTLRIDIWSDVVCPWCYIGKRNLESALAALPGAGPVELVWRSFQLDPDAPDDSGMLVVDALARKMGASADQVRAMQAQVAAAAARAGLEYRLDGVTVANTRRAHRLVHWAAEQGRAGELEERLFKANFVDGLRVGDPATLVRLAAEAGLDPERARAVLAGDQYDDAVGRDLDEARRRGIRGVPFFLFNGEAGLSGAQPPLAFVQLINQALAA